MSSSSRPFVCTGSELLRPERAPAALAERETRGEASGGEDPRASRPQRAAAPSRPSEPARYPDLALTTTFFRPTRTSSRCHPSLATPRGE